MRTWAHPPCLLALLLALLAGCSHKTNTGTELEKAAQLLADRADTQPPPAAPPPQDPTPSVPQPATPEPVPPGTPSQEMRQAIASYRSGNLEDAVTRLQKLRMTVILTPQQRMAVQDGIAALMSEVYGLAERGDARAIQAVKQYEEMQTTR